MPPRSSRPSHRSIVTQVAQIRRSLAEAPLRETQSALAAVLDSVNALGALDALREAALSKALSGGPLVVQGSAPEPWVGAVIWQRAPGYFGYKTLSLFGLWAVRLEDGTQLRAGVRRLAYALDFYEADAYHKRIRREFALYYADDGAPPSVETAAWTARYTPEDRLALRAAVAAALQGLVRA
jgi:hypothetical protein